MVVLENCQKCVFLRENMLNPYGNITQVTMKESLRQARFYKTCYSKHLWNTHRIHSRDQKKFFL